MLLSDNNEPLPVPAMQDCISLMVTSEVWRLIEQETIKIIQQSSCEEAGCKIS